MAIVDLDRDTLRAGLSDGSILLIDVREAQEFAMGHIPDSLSMPLSGFNPAEIPDAPGQRIVFSCAAGVRSRHALMMAQAAGMPLSEHYAGGFKDWATAGEAIAR
jgi:rhodanese-related sulfurtransferase